MSTSNERIVQAVGQLAFMPFVTAHAMLGTDAAIAQWALTEEAKCSQLQQATCRLDVLGCIAPSKLHRICLGDFITFVVHDCEGEESVALHQAAGHGGKEWVVTRVPLGLVRRAARQLPAPWTTLCESVHKRRMANPTRSRSKSKRTHKLTFPGPQMQERAQTCPHVQGPIDEDAAALLWFICMHGGDAVVDARTQCGTALDDMRRYLLNSLCRPIKVFASTEEGIPSSAMQHQLLTSVQNQCWQPRHTQAFRELLCSPPSRFPGSQLVLSSQLSDEGDGVQLEEQERSQSADVEEQT